MVLGLITLKGVVLRVVGLYKAFNRILLRMRGLTEADVSYRRVVTGQAWDEFCDSLKAAGASIIGSDSPKDALNQAEGYRYLARLTRVALENFIECSDTTRPQLVSLANGTRVCRVCIGSDNPDNFYQSAMIDARSTYRISGSRGTVNYLGFGVQSGAYGSPGGLQTVDYKEAKEVQINDDGNFVLYIAPNGALGAEIKGKNPPKSNVLSSRPERKEGLFIVRQTFAVRSKEIAANLKIELVRGPGGSGAGSPDPTTSDAAGSRDFTPQQLDDGLQKAGMFVGGASMMFARWAKGFRAKATNQLPLFDQKVSDSVGGDPNIRYYHSYWSLEPDEALVIDASPPECRTWNFQLNNHWMESLDYRYYTVHTNKFLAKYRDDRSVRLVVAHRDPKLRGVNWIDTVGHNCGTMCWRWVMPAVPDSELPHPRPRVVKFDQLKKLK